MIRKHLYVLYLNKEVKEIFTPGPMVSFQRARKLGNYFVRAKLYPLERSVGSFKCNGKRCQVHLNVTETKQFSSTVTKEEYKIEDVTITFIDNTDPKDLNQRKHYSRHTLKTMAPLGFNVEDD